MSFESVDNWKSILRALFTNEMSINDIFRRIGLSKRRFTKEITTLQEGGFIAERKEKNSVQKKIKLLTALGKDVTRLIIDLEVYDRSVSDLRKGMKDKAAFKRAEYVMAPDDNKAQNPDQVMGKHFKEVLLRLGWPDNEIQFYDYCRTSIVDFRYICERNFMDILLSRYAQLLDSFDLNNQEREITHNIILKSIYDRAAQILCTIEDEKEIVYGQKVDGIWKIRAIPSAFERHLDDIEKVFLRYPMPSVLFKEVRSMWSSYISMLNPVMDAFKVYSGQVKDSLQQDFVSNRNTSEVERTKKQYQYNTSVLKGVQVFLDSYEEYRSGYSTLS